MARRFNPYILMDPNPVRLVASIISLFTTLALAIWWLCNDMDPEWLLWVFITLAALPLTRNLIWGGVINIVAFLVQALQYKDWSTYQWENLEDYRDMAVVLMFLVTSGLAIWWLYNDMTPPYLGVTFLVLVLWRFTRHAFITGAINLITWLTVLILYHIR